MSRGSSPLARGLRVDIIVFDEAQRIIPARAGFTLPPPPPRAASADHPRSRGVYTMGDLEVGDHVGSSPLARGLPVRLVAYR